MRRIFIRRKPDELVKLLGGHKPKPGKPLTDLNAFGTVVSLLAGLATAGFAAFIGLAWLAWESHTFGPKDLRYLVFVRGTLIERVGAIDAQPGTLVYTGQGRDGTAPGHASAHYKSQVAADALFAHLLERCRSLGLQVKQKRQPSSEGELSASCGREAEDEYHLHFSVRAGQPTEVSMGEDINDGVSVGY